MNGVWPIALNGFRESRRNRITVIVFAFALVMIFSSTVALEMTVATFDRVMTDLGLGVLSIITTFLAIFLGSGLIPREIERRTIFMIVAKPVSRTAFIVGRLIGNLLTIGFVMALMAALFFAQVAWNSSPHSSQLVAIYGVGLQLVLLTSIAFAVAATSSQYVTAIVSTGLYFLGHLSGDLYKMAERSTSSALSLIGKALYYLIPNFERLDFKPRATYLEPTTGSELLSASMYTVGYSAVLIVVACALFSKRDFK
jgi:ABC-type transport system involved in multi-copper enzyme maturation permease subunit